jgi:hypothetical protein
MRGDHLLSTWLSAHPINTATPMHVAFCLRSVTALEAADGGAGRQRFFVNRIPHRSLNIFITLGCNEMTFSISE